MHAMPPPTPPSTLEPAAAWSEFRHIQVTRVVEDSSTTLEHNVEVRRPDLHQELTTHKHY